MICPASGICLRVIGAGRMTGWPQLSTAARMWTPLGWQCRTGVTEFNERSIQNFPVQGPAQRILRIACIWATGMGSACERRCMTHC